MLSGSFIPTQTNLQKPTCNSHVSEYSKFSVHHKFGTEILKKKTICDESHERVCVAGVFLCGLVYRHGTCVPVIGSQPWRRLLCVTVTVFEQSVPVPRRCLSKVHMQTPHHPAPSSPSPPSPQKVEGIQYRTVCGREGQQIWNRGSMSRCAGPAHRHAR